MPLLAHFPRGADEGGEGGKVRFNARALTDDVHAQRHVFLSLKCAPGSLPALNSRRRQRHT
jgi:hypothetical protein